jgi:acyl-CoA reductase-like NAD-dependent aldehyde dehydrogenase
VDAGADAAQVAERLTTGAFFQSGQSCISVQRVIAHASIAGALREELVARAARLRRGDPLRDDVDMGPLISEADARRIEEWIGRAVAAGAHVLCGGRRDGAFVDATWIEHVPPDQPLVCEEVFGPVGVLSTFQEFDDALRQANSGRYGLQAGLFTNNLQHALRAFEQLDFGGVVLNDVPSMRVDSMPYGGVKDSGLGREGVRYAIEELTDRKTLVLRT